MTDDPIIPVKDATPRYAAEIIDLGSVRVQHGLSRNPHKRCLHKSLVYDPSERRIWCSDCERTIDGFDAFMTFARDFHDILSRAQARLDEAQKLADAQIHMKALKAVERAWRGPNTMAVCCPHCSRGLLPEDFARGGNQMSRELEIARREKERARRPALSQQPAQDGDATDA